MAPKPPFPRALAVWLGMIPALLLAAWLAGHLYWQVRIGRALSTLGTPSTDQDLIRIGSRGIPRFVDELEGALSRHDEKQARAFARGVVHLIAGAYEGLSPANQRVIEDQNRFQSLEAMHDVVRGYRDMPAKDRAKVPPWWMWWKGRFATSP